MKTTADFFIEDAQRKAEQLKKEYNAPVIWIGDNHFIVVKEGNEIKI